MINELGLGHFWLQSQPDTQFPGNLIRHEDGGLEVELLGSVDIKEGNVDLTQLPDGDAIYGLADNRFYRLVEPWQKSMQIRIPGPPIERWIAGLGLSSNDLAAVSRSTFGSVQIGLSGLEQILKIQPTTPGTVEVNGARVQVVKPNERISHRVDFSRGAVRFESNIQERHSADSAVSFSLNTSLTIEFKTPATVWSIATDLERVNNLIALMTGTPHHPTREILFPSHISDEIHPLAENSPVSIHRRRAIAEAASQPHPDDVLIDIDCEVLCRLVAAWLECGAILDAPSAMVVTRLHSQIKIADVLLLLNVAALESLHRSYFDELLQPKSEFKEFREKLSADLGEFEREWLMDKTEHANRKSLKFQLIDLVSAAERSDIHAKLSNPDLLKEIRTLRNSVSHRNTATPLDGRRLLFVAILAGHLAINVMLSKVLDLAGLDLPIRADRMTRLAIRQLSV